VTTSDAVTVGLTPEGHANLQRLKDVGVFADMLDGYRFAIGLAIRPGLEAPEGIRTNTIFNVGSLDRDGLIRDTATTLFPDAANRPYAFAERLAEAGVKELVALYDSGQLRFTDLFASTSYGKQSDE
jgi:hypothetical protein